jgi:hypothetical protein
MFYKTCFLIIAIFYSSLLFAQNCANSKAFKQCSFPDDSSFDEKFSWSKSFRKGQTKQYVLTFMKGRNYFVSVCSKDYKKDIHIKLRMDNEKQDVIYDNAINELSKTLELQFDETKKLIIEIAVPPGNINESKVKYFCIGMRMFYKKGF